MLPPRISLIQGQISQNRENYAVLKNGSIVTGRVLENRGDGIYRLSLAGQKIDVKSNAFLRAGSVFSAKVEIKGSVLNLFLVKEKSGDEGKFFQKIDGKSGITEQVSNLLTSMGFEANEESLKILLFMQQLGMKIDVPGAKKALAKSKSDGKVNQEKAEISFLLEEKGIHSDNQKVMQIIQGGEKDRQEGRKEKNQKEEAQKIQKDRQLEDAFQDSPCEEFKMTNNPSLVKSYFESVDKAALEQKSGLLTVFNTVLSKSKENSPLNHWLLLPFEWEYQSSFGEIKLLFDSELKNLQKTIIDIKTSDKKKIFVLYYKNNVVDSVGFAMNENLSENKKSEMCKVLAAMLNTATKRNILVHWADFENLKGFSPADGEFGIINGKV